VNDDGLGKNRIGAAGFEPTIFNEAGLTGTAKRQAARRFSFGLEESARGAFGVQILLISESESGLHIVCNFGGQALSVRVSRIRTASKRIP
jgi:hypothetical protein